MALPAEYREPQMRFFNFMFGPFPSRIEVRHLSASGGASIMWFKGAAELNGWLHTTEMRENLFYGVLPRKFGTVGGTAENVVESGFFLWADLDHKGGSAFADLIDSPLPPPCAIVGSGHGWHAYWKLRFGIEKRVIEILNRNIAAILGSDAVGDAARIMRVPYTVNVKPGMPEIRTTVVRLEDTCTGHYPESFTIRPTKDSRRRAMTIRKAMPEGHVSRSEKLFSLAISFVLKGKTDLYELESIMLGIPEGTKLLEMSPTRRMQWIDLTYKNAKRTIVKPPVK